MGNVEQSEMYDSIYLINLHPNVCSQEFDLHPFSDRLDGYFGSCNTLNDLPNKACVPNKKKDLHLSVLSLITGINLSKTLTNHISCE